MRRVWYKRGRVGHWIFGHSLSLGMIGLCWCQRRTRGTR